ncbi:hypothetical protein D1872_247870 [compost metagenome]
MAVQSHQAQQMRRDQADEADRPHCADRDRSQQYGGQHADGTRRGDTLAQRFADLLVHQKDVEVAAEQRGKQQPARNPRPDRRNVLPVVLNERAGSPQEQARRFILKQQLQRSGQRRKHKRQGHAPQGQANGSALPPSGKQEHDRPGKQPAGHSGQQRKSAHQRRKEYRRHHDRQIGARINAQRSGGGERIAR